MIKSNECLDLVLVTRVFLGQEQDVCGGGERRSLLHRHGGAPVRVRGVCGRRQLLVPVLINLLLHQLVPRPDEVRVLGEVVPLRCGPGLLLLSVPGMAREKG